MLRDFVNFDEADAGDAVETAHLGGVASGWQSDEHDGIETGGRRTAAGFAKGESAHLEGGGTEGGLGGGGRIPVVVFAEESVAAVDF